MKTKILIIIFCLVFLTLGFSAGQLNVTLITPDSDIPENVAQNTTIFVNVSIKCLADDCGVVMGSLRYNQSGTEPDQLVNISEEEKPFYKMNTSNTSYYTYVGITQPSKTQWAASATVNNKLSSFGLSITGEGEISNTEYLDLSTSNNGRLVNDTLSMGNFDTHKFNFTIREMPGDIKNITLLWEGYSLLEDAGANTVGIFLWNYSSSQWQNLSWPSGTSDVTERTNLTIQSQINDALLNSGSKDNLFFAAQADCWGCLQGSELHTDFARIEVTAIQNTTQGCGNMYQNDICYLAWTINATGEQGKSWYLDANFSGTSVTDENNTLNFQINILGPAGPTASSVVVVTPELNFLAVLLLFLCAFILYIKFLQNSYQ